MILEIRIWGVGGGIYRRDNQILPNHGELFDFLYSEVRIGGDANKSIQINPSHKQAPPEIILFFMTMSF